MMLLDRDDVANNADQISEAVEAAAKSLYHKDQLDILEILMKRENININHQQTTGRQHCTQLLVAPRKI